MRNTMIGAGLVFSLLVTAGPAAAQMPEARALNLSFDAQGRVNLTAQNVTVREILAEWARLCGCLIVNAAQLPGGSLTTPIQFENASQSAVLESLLRQAAGYVLTPKRAGVQSASHYETIYILATSNPITGAYIPPPMPAALPLPTAGSPDDEIPPIVPPGAAGAGQTSAPPPAQPASSNPFGSPSVFGSGSPFGGTPPNTTPTPPAQPGTVAPAPPSTPGSVIPRPYGTPVPIVPVPSSGQ